MTDPCLSPLSRQQSIPVLLRPPLVLFHLLLPEIIDMIEHFPQHVPHILFVASVVQHMRMPQEISHSIGDYYIIGFFEAEVEELDVVPIAGLVVQLVEGKIQ